MQTAEKGLRIHIMKTNLRNTLLLLTTAIIWGVAFVAQSEGGNAVGPYSFSSLRSIIGAIVLIPVIVLFDRMGITKKKEEKKEIFTGGILCGIFLSLASIFQQLGLYLGSEAGKAGFLTAFYIILVPLLGLAAGRKCGGKVWVAVGLSLIGLYLLCMTSSLGLQKADIMILICSAMYAFHILTVDRFAPKADVVRMSFVQFVTAAIICGIPAVFIDLQRDGADVWLQSLQTPAAWISILYAGVLSSGVAYTLQNIAQQDYNPTVASLILSLESVFSVIAGWLILDQILSGRQIAGCILIFIAIILSQLPSKEKI